MKYSILLFSIVLLAFQAFINRSETPQLRTKISRTNQTTNKETAFIVLRDKCNVCHATKKRTDIFTLENMDSLAVDISKQVFIKKKMPKGRKVKLTEVERTQLKVWLDETLIEN